VLFFVASSISFCKLFCSSNSSFSSLCLPVSLLITGTNNVAAVNIKPKGLVFAKFPNILKAKLKPCKPAVPATTLACKFIKPFFNVVIKGIILLTIFRICDPINNAGPIAATKPPTTTIVVFVLSDNLLKKLLTPFSKLDKLFKTGTNAPFIPVPNSISTLLALSTATFHLYCKVCCVFANALSKSPPAAAISLKIAETCSEFLPTNPKTPVNDLTLLNTFAMLCSPNCATNASICCKNGNKPCVVKTLYSSS